MKKVLLLTILMSFLFCQESYSYKKEIVMVPMKDGTKLYTEVYFPDNLGENEKLPAILTRTIYGTPNDMAIPMLLLTELVDTKKFVCVLQDVRGTGKSEGKYSGYKDDGWLENKDCYETVQWIALQKWCNGSVSMKGISASSVQINLGALTETPNLVCGFSEVSHWDLYRDAFYPGGAISVLYFEGMKSTNNYDPVVISDFLNRYKFDETWEYYCFGLRKEHYNIPTFHGAGWYDINFGPSLLNAYNDINTFGGNNAKGKQKLMIGPWTHWSMGYNVNGEISFPQNAKVDLNSLSIEWFDYWMNNKKDNSIANYPNVSLYLMGPVDTIGHWNQWLYFSDLPFADTDTMSLYLTNEKLISKTIPQEGEISLVYDPNFPFYSNAGIQSTGPKNINNIWNSDKILTFEAPIYNEPYDILGGIQLEVYLSSDREDTDVFAQLVDIYPDGRKIFFAEGILRARFRNGFDKEDFLIPGQITKLTVDLHHTTYTIVPGHKLGLLLSCSNSALYYPNPNTSDSVNKAKDTLVANNTFHFGGDNATVLVLPIRKTGPVNVSEGIQKKSVSVYPNPFSETTVISYQLAVGGNVRIDIFNSLGEKITMLVDEQQEAGSHSATFSVRANGRSPLQSGMYYYKIQIGQHTESGKLLLIK